MRSGKYHCYSSEDRGKGLIPLFFPRYFNRDVECIRTFFRRRFQYESALYPRFKSTLKDNENGASGVDFRLDVVVAASGFKRRDMQILDEVRCTH
jgi:RIO kinase 2